MGSDILQIILLTNVFLLGIVVAATVQHFRGHKAEVKPQTLSETTRQELAQAMRQEFKSSLEASSASLQNDMNSTAKELNRLLSTFGTEILQEEMKLFRNNLEQIRKKTEAETGNTHGQIAAHQAELEMDLAKRRGELEQRVQQQQAALEKTILDLQTSVEQSLAKRQENFVAAISKRETDLNASFEAQLAKEQAFLIGQIDTRLNDAVASFLVNALGAHVDLGAQGPYLMKLLDEHKAELKQEVGSGPSTTS